MVLSYLQRHKIDLAHVRYKTDKIKKLKINVYQITNTHRTTRFHNNQRQAGQSTGKCSFIEYISQINYLSIYVSVMCVYKCLQSSYTVCN